MGIQKGQRMSDTPQMKEGTILRRTRIVGFELRELRRTDAETKAFLFSELPEGGLVVGRGSAAGFVVGDEPGSRVSRAHASITYDPQLGACVLTDTSRNGTVITHPLTTGGSTHSVELDGDSIPLRDGDRLYLAATIEGGDVFLMRGGTVVGFSYVEAVEQ